MRIYLLFICAHVGLMTMLGAEYRVALVISDDDSKSVVADLEKYGFQCEATPNLSEKEFGRKIESWAGRTPANSTALIYFDGVVRNQVIGGSPTACLITGNDRAFPVAKVFEVLNSRGGSRENIVVVSSKTKPVMEVPLGESNLFTFKEIDAALQEAGVGGRGSVAISPPDKFVPGRKTGDEWVNARGMVFCWCPPGKYMTGSPEGTLGRHSDEEQSIVEIENGFWIGKYEVTRAHRKRNSHSRSVGTQKNHPIEMLHWDDGRRDFHRVLTEEERKEGRLPSGWEYDLPSSEQWEYAARAGTKSLYYFGDGIEDLPEHANFADKRFYDSGDIYSNHAHRTLNDGFVRLAPVGSFKPNPWGLHDVYGNVVEWCRDKSARGGGWVSPGANCRSAYRDSYSSRNEQNYLGYRIVIQQNVPEPKKK